MSAAAAVAPGSGGGDDVRPLMSWLPDSPNSVNERPLHHLVSSCPPLSISLVVVVCRDLCEMKLLLQSEVHGDQVGTGSLEGQGDGHGQFQLLVRAQRIALLLLLLLLPLLLR